MKKYLKNCKCLFPVYGKHERQYIKHLECHIQEYLAEHDNCTYDDLVTEFGSPSEIVGSYYRSTDNNSLIRNFLNLGIIESRNYIRTSYGSFLYAGTNGISPFS